MKEPKEGDSEGGNEGKNAVLADSVMSVLTMLCNEPLRNNRINLNAAADAVKVRTGPSQSATTFTKHP